MQPYADFFIPGTKLAFDDDYLVATLPDGRKLFMPMDGMRYYNPNAKPIPYIDVSNMPEWLKPKRSAGGSEQ
jgi:hypothetical protein